MATDLDLFNLPLQRGGIREIFDATNAWPGAPAHLYFDINRTPFGVYQTGYDPDTQRCWMRYKAFPDSPWTVWKTFEGSQQADAPLVQNAYRIEGGSAVLVSFSVVLDRSAVPANTAFTVTSRTVTSVLVGPGGDTNSVKLILNSNLANTGNPVVSYVQPAPPRLKSIDGIDVASFSNLAIIL